MYHAVLLGDSIFDNKAYVAGGPDVVSQLRRRLPEGWRATLAAVDGSRARHVLEQLAEAPPDATHFLISAGGNDALAVGHMLGRTVRSVADALNYLASHLDDFDIDYGRMIDALAGTGKAVAVCTVYDCVPGLPREAKAGLGLFNDAIVRHAIRGGVPLLDLRRVCREVSDYSAQSPIEPSQAGGAKIASALTAMLAAHDFTHRRCTAYPLLA